MTDKGQAVVVVSGVDREPIERLLRIAQASGVSADKFRDTCTGPQRLAGKTLFQVRFTGDKGAVKRVLGHDPGLEFKPERMLGSHQTGRRWWVQKR